MAFTGNKFLCRLPYSKQKERSHCLNDEVVSASSWEIDRGYRGTSSSPCSCMLHYNKRKLQTAAEAYCSLQYWKLNLACNLVAKISTSSGRSVTMTPVTIRGSLQVDVTGSHSL